MAAGLAPTPVPVAHDHTRMVETRLHLDWEPLEATTGFLLPQMQGPGPAWPRKGAREMLIDWDLDRFTVNHLSLGPTSEFLKVWSSWAPAHLPRLRRPGSSQEDPSSEASLRLGTPSLGSDPATLGGAETLLDPGARAAGVPGFSRPGKGGKRRSWGPELPGLSVALAGWPHSSLTAGRWPLQTAKPGQTD